LKKVLRVVLVDDEEYCRQDLAELLRKTRQVEVVGEAANAREAVQLINQKNPDLVFLDLNLSDIHGFKILSGLEKIPTVIAVTAFSQHAAEGFSMNLTDYILKPVEEKRLQIALLRARDHILLRSLKEHPILQLEVQGTTTQLSISDIYWVKASENYVEIFSAQGNGLLRSTFLSFKNNLPPGFTLEISRSVIVARHQVRDWERDSKGHLHINLKCGIAHKVSKRMQKDVLHQLELLN
jgi:two-component system LytT family response regulator